MQARTWNGNTFKIETSRAQSIQEWKYCLLPFSFSGVCSNFGQYGDYDDDDNSRVCCENIAMSLKNCAIRAVFRRRPPQALLVVKIDLSPLCSAWPGAALAAANKAAPADSSVFYQIKHVRWNVKVFLRSFPFLKVSDNSSRIRNLDAQNEWWWWKLNRGKTVIFSRKRRTKDCFLLTHNLKNKKVSVRDKIYSRCAICSPAVKRGPSLAEVSQAVSVAKSSQYNVLHNGNIWISQFLSSYPVILTFAETSYLI